ncbi:hypothetical protein HHI36_011319 [Cryptolaemus montrouzieri]|uniref:Endonuclease/exonuclease/phosphatase domain-containing protein n=1 Tax=Cryptolaemus montrouzieri TaxID=559131 RepID=A0ABD2MLE6_9CUCU
MKLAKEKDKSKGEMKIENDEEHLKQTKHKKRENQTIEKKDQIYQGTWNARTTYVEGTLIRLIEIMKKYAIDILALQETKQLGNFVKEVGNYIFFNSGGEDRRFEFKQSKMVKTKPFRIGLTFPTANTVATKINLLITRVIDVTCLKKRFLEKCIQVFLFSFA